MLSMLNKLNMLMLNQLNKLNMMNKLNMLIMLSMLDKLSMLNMLNMALSIMFMRLVVVSVQSQLLIQIQQRLIGLGFINASLFHAFLIVLWG